MSLALEKSLSGALGRALCLEITEVPPGHPDRRQCEWLAARDALGRVFRRLSESSDPTSIRFPNPRFSLSHTTHTAVAVGVERGQGIGVDVEEGHPVDPRAARFFLSPDEMRQDISKIDLLRLWTVKEALFKADPDNRGRGLCDYVVDSPSHWEGLAAHPTGIRFAYATRPMAGGFLSIAFRYEPNGKEQ